MPNQRDSAVLTELLNELQEMAEEFSALRSDVRALKDNVARLDSRFLGDGQAHGVPTIIALHSERLQRIDVELTKHDTKIKGVVEEVEQIDEKIIQLKLEDKHGRVMMWTATITGAFGAIAGIAVLVFKYVLK